MARHQELKKRRDRFELLADWYGEAYATTEIAAHTDRCRKLDDALDAILRGIDHAEITQLLKIQQDWAALAGAGVARFTRPVSLEHRELQLEIRHSALIPELTPSLELVRAKISERFGDGVCEKIRLVIAGSRSRRA